MRIMQRHEEDKPQIAQIGADGLSDRTDRSDPSDLSCILANFFLFPPLGKPSGKPPCGQALPLRASPHATPCICDKRQLPF